MQKIIFIGLLAGGGKERRMCELIRHLYQIGNYKLYLLTIDDGKSSDIAYPYVLPCLEQYLKISRKCSRWETYKTLWNVINKIKPDIIHDWIGYRIGIYLLPHLPLRKFYYISGHLADGNKDSFIHSIINRIVFLFSDKIVSNSYAGILSHKAIKNKSIVIYNGFNPDRLPQTDKSEEIRDSLNLKNKKIISMAARLSPAKDYKMFLDVALRIQKQFDDVIFLIIGKGVMESYLKEYARTKKIENVKFLGFRDDIIDLFKVSDVTLLCSNSEIHAEGVSNSIMESMACGTPVIATEGGGTNEIIENGTNGYIVPPHDDLQMSELLIQLLTDKSLHTKFAQACIQTIQTKFSITKMVNEYINIYNKAVNI